MKRLKKLVGFLLTMIMVLGMASTASAATITINDEGGKSSYAAYRLLNATNSKDDKTLYAYTLNDKYTDILKDVTEKETETEIIAYIAALTDDTVQTFADDVYAEIKDDSAITPDAVATDGVFDDVAQGYYLIEETAVNNDGKDSYSLVMLDTAGLDAITVDTKEDIPEVEKKVKDKDDSTGEITEWQDSADYDLNDSIPYQITGTLPSNYAEYKTYYYKFKDSMSAGLTYNNDAKVFVVNETGEVEITSAATIAWTEATETEDGLLTVKFDDLKKVTGVTIDKDSKIVVRYTATLNDKAVIGSAGNPNTVTLEYERNPYYDGNGQSNPGETPEDTNIVFTFKAVVNKVNSEKKPLTGAGFTLYKFDKEQDKYIAVGAEQVGGTTTTFAFNRLDAGQYKIVETTVPAGYNKAADIEFMIVAEHDEESGDPKLTKLEVQDMSGNVISGTDLEFTAAATTGTVSTDVVNNSGTELPSTGGVGTTIFYIIGCILVALAGILLVSRRRMAK